VYDQFNTPLTSLLGNNNPNFLRVLMFKDEETARAFQDLRGTSPIKSNRLRLYQSFYRTGQQLLVGTAAELYNFGHSIGILDSAEPPANQKLAARTLAVAINHPPDAPEGASAQLLNVMMYYLHGILRVPKVKVDQLHLYRVLAVIRKMSSIMLKLNSKDSWFADSDGESGLEPGAYLRTARMGAGHLTVTERSEDKTMMTQVDLGFTSDPAPLLEAWAPAPLQAPIDILAACTP